MKPEIAQILQGIQSDDLDQRNTFVGLAGLLLERSTIDSPTKQGYEGAIPDSLLSIRLTIGEQQDLIAKLCNVISSEKMTEGMIWALGKASRDLVFEPFLDLVHTYNGRFGKQGYQQILVVLDTFIVRSGTREALQKQNILIDRYDVTQLVHRIAASRESKTQELASWLQQKIRDAQDFTFVT